MQPINSEEYEKAPATRPIPAVAKNADMVDALNSDTKGHADDKGSHEVNRAAGQVMVSVNTISSLTYCLA